jgi:capsular polysaccharide biosynthesis protein
LASHLALLESDYLLTQYVAKNPSRDMSHEDFHNQLEKMITVEADKQQSLIRLSVRHSNGKTASEIALGLVDAAAEVQRDREQLRGEARVATSQAMHSK